MGCTSPRSVASRSTCPYTLREPYLRWFARPFRYCFTLLPALESAYMLDRTETLRVGSQAPDFSLATANREGTFQLSALLPRGTLILEFLRGTW
jgi:hypothetical protein